MLCEHSKRYLSETKVETACVWSRLPLVDSLGHSCAQPGYHFKRKSFIIGQKELLLLINSFKTLFPPFPSNLGFFLCYYCCNQYIVFPTMIFRYLKQFLCNVKYPKKLLIWCSASDSWEVITWNGFRSYGRLIQAIYLKCNISSQNVIRWLLWVQSDHIEMGSHNNSWCPFYSQKIPKLVLVVVILQGRESFLQRISSFLGRCKTLDSLAWTKKVVALRERVISQPGIAIRPDSVNFWCRVRRHKLSLQLSTSGSCILPEQHHIVHFFISLKSDRYFEKLLVMMLLRLGKLLCIKLGHSGVVVCHAPKDYLLIESWCYRRAKCNIEFTDCLFLQQQEQ